MQPLGQSLNTLARDLAVAPNHISEILYGKRAISADTALRLAHYFGKSAEFWINLQADCGLRTVCREYRHVIEAQVHLRSA